MSQTKEQLQEKRQKRLYELEARQRLDFSGVEVTVENVTAFVENKFVSTYEAALLLDVNEANFRNAVKTERPGTDLLKEYELLGRSVFTIESVLEYKLWRQSQPSRGRSSGPSKNVLVAQAMLCGFVGAEKASKQELVEAFQRNGIEPNGGFYQDLLNVCKGQAVVVEIADIDAEGVSFADLA